MINVGKVYRLIHGVNNQHQLWNKRTYRWVSNCNTNQILVFGGYVILRESLYTQAIIWVKSILNNCCC